MANKYNYVKKHPNFIDRIGYIYDQFIVIEYIGYKKANVNSKQKKSFVKVKCLKCDKIYELAWGNFTHRTPKCCKPKNTLSKRTIRIYAILNGMIFRCYNKDTPRYKDYGLKGIIVCDEWRENRDNFLDWALKNGYEDNLTIDRIDNNIGYFPYNCRWVNREVQSRNRIHVLDIENVIKIKKMIMLGLSNQAICNILDKNKSTIANIRCGKSWSNISVEGQIV